MNEATNFLKTSQETLQKIAHSIPTTDIASQNDAMTKIAAMNHAYLILNSETTKEKTRTPRNRTTAVTINGVKHEAKSQKDAMHIVCQDLVKNKYKDIKANNDKFISSVTGEHFASINKSDLKCENPTTIKSGKKEFYYDPHRIGLNNGMLFKKMIKTMNLPDNYMQLS
jgi:hypothetical protein